MKQPQLHPPAHCSHSLEALVIVMVGPPATARLHSKTGPPPPANDPGVFLLSDFTIKPIASDGEEWYLCPLQQNHHSNPLSF